jgi:hypothetical protein
MEKPSTTGAIAQKILCRIQDLSAVAFSEELDEDSRDGDLTRQLNMQLLHKWNDLSDNLTHLWILIKKRTDFTPDDIDSMHVMCNKFMSQWLELLGKDHLTNYMHIVGSGHLTYFASKFGNLYRYSQQGWESLNQLLKHYYFNNTNHGGAAGNGGKSSVGLYNNGVISGNHCRPLMQLCQRSVTWKLGIGDAYFKDILQCANKEDHLDDEGLNQTQQTVAQTEHYVNEITYGVL